jgi:hypothetical protein
MNEADVIAPCLPEALSSVVTELDNPVLAQVTAESVPAMVEDQPLVIVPIAPADRQIDAWETVAFPDAIIDVSRLPEAASIDIVTSLEHQNHTLRDRVNYLETTLSQAQGHLCQEVARWESLALRSDEQLQAELQTQEQTIAQYVNELTDSQQKVTEMFAQLEHAHQTAQRQQIVMETLNTQLRNSQERVAQLERECAGIHQKNVDQAQQVLQQDHQVRDLQSRLQRQQRYTLQYKAALEKSLEVAPTTTAPTLLSETTANQLAAKAVTMPKPCPVKPWSAPAAEVQDDSQKAWLNAFLSESSEFPTENVLANFDWQPSQPIDNTPVSFNLEALPEDGQIELDIHRLSTNPAPRLDSWETSPTGASPFITLQAAIDGETAAAAEPAPKRESLAAVDLPMFAKADGIALSQSTPEAAKP